MGVITLLSEQQGYQRIALEALKKYPIHSFELVYLGKSDNVTFRVNADYQGLKYLLKIHCSELGFKTKTVIESELIWLEALARDTDLIVPTPLRNLGDELITEVVTGHDDIIMVTCYSWVNGEILNRQPSSLEAASLAVMMAQLHKHSVQWTAPRGFDRPEYHSANVISSLSHLKQLVHLERITSEQFTWLENSAHKIVTEIEKQTLTQNNWGMIHSDLHESNYVFYHDSPRPIDFSACGYGFYLFDMAETFLHLSPDNRKVFLTSYVADRPLQENYLSLLEPFFIWAILRNYAFLSLHSIEHDYLAKSIPFIIQNYCKPYLCKLA